MAAAGRVSPEGMLQKQSTEQQDTMKRLGSNLEDRSHLTAPLSCLKRATEILGANVTTNTGPCSSESQHNTDAFTPVSPPTSLQRTSSHGRSISISDDHRPYIPVEEMTDTFSVELSTLSLIRTSRTCAAKPSQTATAPSRKLLQLLPNINLTRSKRHDLANRSEEPDTHRACKRNKVLAPIQINGYGNSPEDLTLHSPLLSTRTPGLVPALAPYMTPAAPTLLDNMPVHRSSPQTMRRGIGLPVTHRFSTKSWLSRVCQVCCKSMMFGVKCKHCKLKCHNKCTKDAPSCCIQFLTLPRMRRAESVPSDINNRIDHTAEIPLQFCTLPKAITKRPDSSSNPSSASSSTSSSPAHCQQSTPPSINTPPPIPSPQGSWDNCFQFPVSCDILIQSSKPPLTLKIRRRWVFDVSFIAWKVKRKIRATKMPKAKKKMSLNVPKDDSMTEETKNYLDGPEDKGHKGSAPSCSSISSIGSDIPPSRYTIGQHFGTLYESGVSQVSASGMQLMAKEQGGEGGAEGENLPEVEETASREKSLPCEDCDKDKLEDLPTSICHRGTDGQWRGPISRKASQTSIYLQEWDIPYEQLQLGELIGKGRWGKVHRGRWHGDVAIRLLEVDGNNQDHLKLFKKEVMNYRQTRHENVVLFMGACMAPPHLAIVTSFCKGVTLYSVVRERGHFLDINKTRQIAQEIVKGMGYLHAKGIIHKDLKSKNVFYDANKVVITDFGLFGMSCVVQEDRRKNMLRIPQGWIYYLSPEIVQKMSPVVDEDQLPFSKAADIYAFGTIWYELQVREWPITNQPVEAEIWLVGSNKGIKKVLMDANLSKEVTEILSACWSFQAEERPTFTQLAEMLEKLPKLNRRLSHPGHFMKAANYVS